MLKAKKNSMYMYVEQDVDSDPYVARYAAPEVNMAEPATGNDLPF